MARRDAVIPGELVEQRRRLGQDKRDEMWDGVLHWVEVGDYAYGRIKTDLMRALFDMADRHGLIVTGGGLFDPAVPDSSNYRVPALMVAGEEALSERGVEGQAQLVIEILEPDGEALDKIPFYSRVGVAELLVIDQNSKQVRRWVARSDGLEEAPPDPDRRHQLDALPVAVWDEGGRLHLETR